MTSAIERLDSEIKDWQESITNARKAKAVLATFFVPDISDCYPSVSSWTSSYDSPGLLTIDVRYALHTADRTWAQLARLIAQLRKAYGVAKFERRVHAYAPTFIENSYDGTVSGDGWRINLTVTTSVLPPKCTVEISEELVTKKVAKVVCA